ncbi:MAG: OmpA family protein [Bacteroidales bacterium]|nr:OmpA family protein [Bacteroidales bacterium]
MKKLCLLLIVALFFLTSQTVNAQFDVLDAVNKAKKELEKANKAKKENEESDKEKKDVETTDKAKKEVETTDIMPAYSGSSCYHDDKMGYNEFYVCTGKTSGDTAIIKKIEGYVHHRFCYAPGGRSPLEIIKNYEEAISQNSGTIFPKSNTRECIKAFMKKGHPSHYQTKYEYMQLPSMGNYYLSGKIPKDTVDYYVCVVAGRIDGKTVYSLVTVKVKSMDKGMVSLDNLDDGLVNKGHIAVYDIHFDTGKSEIKGESYDALKMIAEYLNIHADKQYLIVGHTDNVGDFEANIKLSTERANAVVNMLIVNYSVNKEQLKPYGVGSTSPIARNSTDKGKAKNRRVEIVEK